MFYGNHHMSGSWPTPGGSQHSSYTYANPNNSTPNSSSLGQTSYSQRPPLYGQISPSLPQQYAQRTSSSPATGEHLPHPGYGQEQSAFPTPIGGGGGGGPPGSSHSQQSGPQPPTPGQNTSGGPPSAQEAGAYRAPPTPNNFFPPSTTPQQSSFPSFPGPPPQQSPTVPSPTTTSGGAPRGLVSLSSGMAPPPMGYGSNRGHPMPPITYHYGQMNGGPVLSNMHQPGGQLAMVGGMPGMASPYGHHPGMAPHHHQVYMGHSNGPSQQQDRPFKCDQCPQSFNRNHDLKRHKRIHLAVKPFPCSNCDKSFSRKDALKRHKLVKGCGEKENNSGNNGTTGTNDASPPDRSDVMSDDTDGSPRMVKKE
ncbi:hypothetical protein B0H67DRAFT_8659 [Lasiosphaeris hirsuta]|uniref:C2H2-type domain-containing protein n=1 Tax=Lasiosphaeris hirsuta TaxID=260670 RepID=A0AA40B8U4_9PEZI|nr:hypothetical protein B0H67DRAFT_8659 [Lasiosphaeris hirsuta]